MNFKYAGITGWILFLGTFLVAQNSPTATPAIQDTPYPQIISEKYPFVKGVAQFGDKIVVDQDDNVYALTSEGLFLKITNKMVKNRQYRPLQDKIPVDITAQSPSGELYYLFDDHYLSNTHAGKPYGKFDSRQFTRIAVNANGDVLLVGGHHFQLNKEDVSTNGRESDVIEEVRAQNEDFYIKNRFGISRYQDGRFEPVVNDSKITCWTTDENQLFIGNETGYYIVDPSTGSQVLPQNSKLPVLPPTSMVVRDGKLWMGSALGFYMTENHNDFRYFASKRWLLEDEVLDIDTDSEGNAYALTPTGISEVKYVMMTLEDKATYFLDKIRKRHLRYGLIGELRFQEEGDISTMEMIDTDNDGLWTAFYLGSEVFRYATTGDQKARIHVMESFEAYERLLSINQLEGFPSRTFERTGFKVSDPNRWQDSPEEGWEWKGHTSSDEFVAYIWVAGILHQYLDLNDEEEARVADFVDQIMMHLIRNDYYLIDADGKPTLWGRWNPEYLNSYPRSVVDRKLGSTTITAGLHLAYKLTGKDIYKKEWIRLFDQHGYLENLKIPVAEITPTPNVFYKGHNMGEGGWNHSDDEMAFLTYWILYHFAPDEKLKATYADVITDHWAIEKPERNALWNVLTYGTSGEIDLESVKWHLQEFPMDQIRWSMQNSHRKDLNFLAPNFREQSTDKLISPAERAAVRHNANPFRLDEGRGGKYELAGDEFLLPYWLGRYLEVIIPVTK